MADWNGVKRDRRLQQMGEVGHKRLREEESSFTPAVDAVSHQLVQLDQPHLFDRTQVAPQHQSAADNNVAAVADKPKKLDAAAKAKITQLLQRTMERQQRKQALLGLPDDSVKQSVTNFGSGIRPRAQTAQSAYSKATHDDGPTMAPSTVVGRWMD